jgi:hypothetical protein
MSSEEGKEIFLGRDRDHFFRIKQKQSPDLSSDVVVQKMAMPLSLI